MEAYDIGIIGGGPAGYYAAERAAGYGLKTLLVEKRALGGTCLNEGCIPTKTFLHAAGLLREAKNGAQQGLSCPELHYSHADVLARKNKVVSQLVSGIGAALKKSKVTVVQTAATVSGQAGAFRIEADGQVFTAAHLLLATGSVPAIPPIPGLKEGLTDGRCITSRELLDLAEVPDKLLVLGGGVIGLEMAFYFAAAGAQVTVVEMLPTIGGHLDKDAERFLRRRLKEEGIAVHTETSLQSVEGHTAFCRRKDGQSVDISFDKLLVCTGRKACTEGLDALPLAKERGAIVTDEQCRTTLPGVYAAGDCNGKYQLAHVAYREAEVAIHTILGKPDRMDYQAIPCVLYLDPEIASVGLTEEEAAAQGYDTLVKRCSINNSGRHLAEHGVSGGFLKLVLDRRSNTLLGAVLVSANASEILYPLTLMVQNKIPAESILRTCFPHPTVCEIIREALWTE